MLKCIFFRSIKIVVHEHGEIFLNGFLYTTFLRLFQSKVDLFIAVSKATKKKLMQNAGIKEDKIQVLYNFVDLNKFNRTNICFDRENERKKLGIKKDEFVVGFAGRLVERKGWRIYLKAFAILSKEISAKAIIIGNGKNRETMLARIRDLRIKEKVTYLGFVSDVRSFYVLLDCFIVPSYWEPMGITELEAQAMGIPVIASDVGGLNEIIENGKNGLLFKSKEDKDLAIKIKLIYRDKGLRNHTIGNGLKNAKKYSLDSYLNSIKEVYLNV